MRCRTLAVARVILVGSVLSRLGAAAPASSLDQRFNSTVKPFVTTYCIGCHSGASPAAMFDMKPYSSMAAVVKDYGHWTHVLERVSAGQMPPKAAKQPPAELRKQVVEWIQAMRAAEAKKNAGDPGVVLSRRLSNAEYNYTIRDLTGVDLQPTREFPVDPANTAGFDNSGESLTMTPSLLNKYLQAARMVGDHMALTPDGILFAPHPMLVETDREKFAIQRIVQFYERQPTDYADYFLAAWRYKHHRGGKTLQSIAKEAKISAKYLPMVWGILNDADVVEAGPVAKLRGMWRAVPANGPEAVVRAKCVEMRDFVARIRKHTAMEFRAPRVAGLSPTSQPLMNYKFRQFNTNRRNWDRAALRMESDPAPVVPTIPRYPGLGRESADRAAALMLRNRAGDQDLVVPSGQREKWEAAFDRFASVFPDVFYIRERGRFFPDDSQDKGRLLSAGYHNVMGYWRDDQPLQELILDDAGKKELHRLWEEFDFLGDHTMRTYVQYYFNQSGEVDGKGRESGTARPSDKDVASTAVILGLRDKYIAKFMENPSNDAVAREAIEYHFGWVNKTLRHVEQLRVAAEPQHVDALVKFAGRAYRRPLSQGERSELVGYYRSLRDKSGLTHEEAIRDSLVRVLMSPNFCFRLDLSSTSGPGKATPLAPHALANRLSYFLWSSMPDEELLGHAAKGDLARREVLLGQVRRMLKDDRVRALAVEFAGNWLGFRPFEQHNSVDRERFPNFTNDLRQAMFEEPVRFFSDVIRRNGSVLDLVFGKHTFVNASLAKHYGMSSGPASEQEWMRVEDATQYGRGGVLPMSVFLTQNAPGLRTSPVKRGFWVVKRVLGEEIPPPPPNVPELPADESKADKPLREMLAAHRDNPACSSCHARFDGFGLAFEGYGPTGERRTKDLAGRAVETTAEFPGGKTGDGLESVREFIREHRQGDFLDNLTRMLFAYSLSRSLQLSDEPAIEQVKGRLAANGYRFQTLVEGIVTSPQFLNRRAGPAAPVMSSN